MAICCIASVPALRSIVIGDASAKPQPKNGIDSSSFLATYASGGKYWLSDSVSHVELCFAITMCGWPSVSAGMFARPSTRQRMPQIHFAPHRLTPHQLRAIAKVHRRGDQNISSIAAA